MVRVQCLRVVLKSCWKRSCNIYVIRKKKVYVERWVRGKFVLAILFVNINIDNMTDIVFKEIRNNDLTQLKQKTKINKLKYICICINKFIIIVYEIRAECSTMRALWTISINLSCGSDFWNFSRRSVFVDPDVFKKLLLWVVKSFTTDHNNSSFFPILLFLLILTCSKSYYYGWSFTTNHKQQPRFFSKNKLIARQPLDDHQTTAVRPPDDRTTIVIVFTNTCSFRA